MVNKFCTKYTYKSKTIGKTYKLKTNSPLWSFRCFVKLTFRICLWHAATSVLFMQFPAVVRVVKVCTSRLVEYCSCYKFCSMSFDYTIIEIEKKNLQSKITWGFEKNPHNGEKCRCQWWYNLLITTCLMCLKR